MTGEQERDLPDGVRAPYDWALEQLRVAEAHAVTRGSPAVIVAVIDLGYRVHPEHAGHLWVNPKPERGDIHGWDFADEDASLEYTGPDENTSTYLRGHHAFIVGEVAAVAPDCPIMVLRVGYQPGQADSWWRAIDYAVQHGARILVIPHGYIQGQATGGTGYFYQGTDFGYPFDLPNLKRAYTDAHRAGCLIVSGLADNRGRRAAFAPASWEPCFPVGSSGRHGGAANIAGSSDYVQAAAPAGDRGTDDPRDEIWGTGGDGNYIPFSGGCMAAGFAGAVAALVWSQYPELGATEIAQVLRNTARGEGWDPVLGHGILDAAAAVSLRPEQLAKRVVLEPGSGSLERSGERWRLHLQVSNPCALDISRGLAVVYNGHPERPADPQASTDHPVTLATRQLGHAMFRCVGLENACVTVDLECDAKPEQVWVQLSVGDAGAPAGCATVQVSV